jgi:CTP:molybdopterin cytidylyltransferase MocA
MVAGLLLAAGAGRRYGMPKALVDLDGRLLVERGLDTLRAAGCAPIVVVLGAAAAEVIARAELPDAIVVVNPDWSTGMGSSLAAGLAAVEASAGGAAEMGSGSVAAVAVLLVDTPGITAAAIDRLARLSTPDVLATAEYHGESGHPVLLGRAHWAGVAQLATGDVGARRYLAAHAGRVIRVPCDDISIGEDVDVPAHRAGPPD